MQSDTIVAFYLAGTLQQCKKTLTSTARLLYALCWKKPRPSHVLVRRNIGTISRPNFFAPLTRYFYSVVLLNIFKVLPMVSRCYLCGEVAVEVGVMFTYVYFCKDDLTDLMRGIEPALTRV
jgi:hypothetical protein